MAGGWQAISATTGVQQAPQSYQIGDAKTWGIAIPGIDLTGYSAQWMLGTPPSATLLNILPQSWMPAGIAVKKTTTGGTLNIVVTGSGSSLASNLRFSLVKADTISLQPGSYWQQAIVFDMAGNPVTVAEGVVNLLPSLLTLETT